MIIIFVIWKSSPQSNTKRDTEKRKNKTMYYLYYDEKATVNYCFLFSLRLIAERDKKENIYNTIKYRSIKELSQ